MKQLSGTRGWEYAYRKRLEEELVIDMQYLADRAVPRTLRYLQGQIRGIRDAIRLLDDVRKDYRLDDDIDVAS